MYFFILLPLFALLAPSDMLLIALFLVVYLLAAALATLKLPKITFPKKFSIIDLFASFAAAYPIGCLFYNNLLYSLQYPESGTKLYYVCFVISAVYILWLSLSLHVVVSFLASRSSGTELTIDNGKSNSKHLVIHCVIIVILALFAVTVSSLSSPIYLFNDSPDVNAYLTMGKGITRGLVPYRDLYDHKGPFLHLIYTIAALISSDSFIGVYVLELINSVAFLFLFYKTLRLYMKDNAIYAIPLVLFSTYSSKALLKGGTLEEFCLPLLMYAVYAGIYYAEKKMIPDVKTGLIIGITSGCIFWGKYTIVGIYIGWIIVPTILAVKQKKYKEYAKLLGSIFAGVLAVSAPFLIYIAKKNALKDFFTIYFYDNIFMYNKNISQEMSTNAFISAFENFFDNNHSGFNCIYLNNLLAFILLIIGIVWCVIRKNKYVLTNFLMTFLTSFLLTFYGKHSYNYYSLIFVVFEVYGITACYSLLRSIAGKLIKKKNKAVLLRVIASVVSLSVVILIPFVSPNTAEYGNSKEHYPQYQVADYINSTGIKDPTLLNYGFVDSGFYYASGIVPTTKYYYKPNIDSEEIDQAQEMVANEGSIDFIVVELSPQYMDPEFAGYERVGMYTYFSEGVDKYFVLFQK